MSIKIVRVEQRTRTAYIKRVLYLFSDKFCWEDTVGGKLALIDELVLHPHVQKAATQF